MAGNVNMMPMIDILFQVVIFFLVAAQIKVSESSLPIVLPQASAAMPLTSKPNEFVVNVDRDGRLFVGDNVVELDNLETQLKQAAVDNPAAAIGRDPGRRAVRLEARRGRDELVQQSWNQRLSRDDGGEGEVNNPVQTLPNGIERTMNSQRHTIRKLDPSETGDLDEQLWPVNLAMVLACGCVGGLIWATAIFTSPDLLRNGYFWMATLVGSILICGGSGDLFGRAARRGGCNWRRFVSVAMHFGAFLAYAAVGAPKTNLGLGPKTEAAPSQLRAIDILPDYHITHALPNRPQEAIDKPLETKLPDKLVLQPEQPQPRVERADRGPLQPRRQRSGDHRPGAERSRGAARPQGQDARAGRSAPRRSRRPAGKTSRRR